MPKIKEYLNINEDKEHLRLISENTAQVITYSFAPVNTVLFKYGERGKKFYFIIRGKISILIPKETKVYIYKNNYLNYLRKLIKLDEKEVLLRCLIANKDYFNYSIGLEENLIISRLDSEEDNDVFKEIKFYLDSEALKKRSSTASYGSNFSSNPIERRSIDEYIEITSLEDFYMLSQEDYKSFTNKQWFGGVDIKKDKSAILAITVYKYHYVAELFTGDKFGDIALDKISSKRAATIIVSENSHFGVIEKSDYDKIIHNVNQNHIDKIKNKLLQFYLISDINKNSMSFYYTQFGFVTAKVGDKLLEENKISDNLYFISQGEYSLSIRKSLLEVEKLIYYFNSEAKLHKGPNEIKYKKNNEEKFDKFKRIKREIKVRIKYLTINYCR